MTHAGAPDVELGVELGADIVGVPLEHSDDESFGVSHIDYQKLVQFVLLECGDGIDLVQNHHRMTSRTFRWQVLLQFFFDLPPHLQDRHHHLVLKRL